MRNHILGRVACLAAVSPLVIGVAAVAASPVDADRAAPDRLASLGPESRQYEQIAEGAYWPALDLSGVAAYVATPEPEAKASFVTLVNHVLAPAWLPGDLTGEVHFVKGWRAPDRETFLAQYQRDPYLIRIKDQTVTVVGGSGRLWPSSWIAVAIQRTDGSVWVDKHDPGGLLGVAERFLAGSLRKPADGKVTMGKQVEEGCVLAYAVEWAKVPDVVSVSAWTDGQTALFALQKSPRMVFIDESSRTLFTCEATTGGKTFTVGTPVVVTVSLHNGLDSAVQIRDYPWHYPFFSFEVRGPDGLVVPLTKQFPRVISSTKEEWRSVPTGGVHAVEIDVGQWYDLSRTGTYEITARWCVYAKRGPYEGQAAPIRIEMRGKEVQRDTEQPAGADPAKGRPAQP